MRIGSTLTTGLRGTLQAVHAYWSFIAAAPPDMLAPESLQKMQENARREAQLGFKRALRTARIPSSRQYFVGRSPVDAIAEAARKNNSAIVVMGAISRSGYKRLLIGNTAERILDELNCDVMVVKPAKFRVPRAAGIARRAIARERTSGGTGLLVELLLSRVWLRLRADILAPRLPK